MESPLGGNFDTLINAPTPGFAAGFNGVNRSLSIPSNASLQPGTGDISLCCWVFPTALTGGYQQFIGKFAGSAAQDSYGIHIADDGGGPYWAAFIVRGGVYQPATFTLPNSVTINQWNFLALTFNHTSGTLTLRVNNTTLTGNANAGAVQQGNSAFSIGGPTPFYNGRIDAAGWWANTLLTTGQLDSIYNGGAGVRFNTIPGTVPSPDSWWDLDGPFGDGLWHDSAGTNHLTANNGVTVVTGIT